MARYRGPKTKISRKFGEPLFGEDRTLENGNSTIYRLGAAIASVLHELSAITIS
jgi:hypothetical protein